MSFEPASLRKETLGALLLLLSLGVLGCGGKGKGDVSGTVTLDGKPLPIGTIAFVPAQGGGGGASAPIKDGAYKAQGVPAGEVKVTVETQSIKTEMDQIAVTETNEKRNMPAAGGKMPPEFEKMRQASAQRAERLKELKAAYRPIPDKYGSPETSGLTLRVQKGENSFDVPLTSK